MCHVEPIYFSTLSFITISWPHGLSEIIGEFANSASSTSANNLSRKPPGSADLIFVLTPSDDLNSPRILPGLRKRPFTIEIFDWPKFGIRTVHLALNMTFLYAITVKCQFHCLHFSFYNFWLKIRPRNHNFNHSF